MKYFLGVDVGGTKTHALIADESGQALVSPPAARATGKALAMPG